MSKVVERFIIQILHNEDGSTSIEMACEPDFVSGTFSMLQLIGCRAVEHINFLLKNPPKVKSTGEQLDMNSVFEKQKLQ